MKEIRFQDADRIAVIAPHPDDECLGAAAVLLLAPEKTDIYVLTDGGHGDPRETVSDEARIRKAQFEEEMKHVKPHAFFWIGVEDTTLGQNPEAVTPIDFKQYTKIFLPWKECLHPDHRAAALMCIKKIREQGGRAECFAYEIHAPFRKPTHYIDITALEQNKRALVRCHGYQAEKMERAVLSLNAFRAAQMDWMPEIHYAEAYEKIDVYEGMEDPFAASNYLALQLLLLHAGADGRGEQLFGNCIERARKLLLDFLVTPSFPDLYLGFPLLGKPSLDVTVLYDEIPKGAQISSPLAAGSDGMMAWLSEKQWDFPGIRGGFAMESGLSEPGAAAICFHSGRLTRLAKSFCEAAGIPQYGPLYADFPKRMPDNWNLSSFVATRTGEGAPLRVSGSLSRDEAAACACDLNRIVRAFETVGFTAFDEPMIERIGSVMAASPDGLVFQFELFPDGSLGTMFSLETSFPFERTEKIAESFQTGAGAEFIRFLEQWGIADERWKIGIEAATVKAHPAARLMFGLFPACISVRWKNAVLQPAKMEFIAKATDIVNGW